MLNVLRFPLRFAHSNRARWILVGVVLVGVLSGLANTALVAVIHQMLAQGGAQPWSWIAVFAALCALVPVGRYISTMLLVRLTEDAVFEARLALGRQILAAPLRDLERVGSHRLLATLTEDVRAISEALAVFPTLCMNLAIIAGAVLYLGWLSGMALLVFVLFLVFGILTYRLPLQLALRYVHRSREAWNGLALRLQGLVFGVKELKLNRRRREDFLHRGLESVAAEYRASNLKGNSIATAAHSWGQILFFLAIGFLVIALPRFGSVAPETLTGYTLTILYLAAPLETILNLLPMLNRAAAAVEAVKGLGLELAAPGLEDTSTAAEPPAAWQKLELCELTHAYGEPGAAESFSVGPVSLTFHPGEVVFLVGGNGSGKTTLAKLLLGLYAPASGEIRLDGRTVSDEERDAYRQLFSAVFSDFFLLEDLYGLASPELDERAREYLVRLQIDHKVEVRDGVLSTVDLSQGQRKRLALLAAYLEDRPVFVFDEWAADQDPHFKWVFYNQLLPELKRRRKGVIAITHDDLYYAAADRIVKLEDGRVQFDGSAREFLEHPSSWAPPASGDLEVTVAAGQSREQRS